IHWGLACCGYFFLNHSWSCSASTSTTNWSVVTTNHSTNSSLARGALYRVSCFCTSFWHNELYCNRWYYKSIGMEQPLFNSTSIPKLHVVVVILSYIVA